MIHLPRPTPALLEPIGARAALFDTPFQAVIGTTLEGSIVFWNDAAARIYGWRAEEVAGRDIVDITPSQVSIAAAERIMARLRQGRSWTGTFQVRHRTGRAFQARVRNLPVRDTRGELLGIIGISEPLLLEDC